MVTFQAAVHDGSIALLRNALLGDLGVDPFGESPHFRPNLAEFDGGRRIVLHRVFKGLVEVAIIEEDVWVVVPSVEVTLDGLDGLDDTIQLFVSGENDEGAVGSGLRGVGLEAAFHKDLVVFLTNFSARRGCGLVLVHRRRLWGLTQAYLMAGGAPAGINILPGELGCLTKRIRMRMTTMRGNSMTMPRGMEMVEFPRRRNGLRKKAKRDQRRPGRAFALSSFSSAVGRGGGPDKALPARRIKSMAVLQTTAVC